MADKKTNLRELSVGIGVYLILNGHDTKEYSTYPQKFLAICKKTYRKDFSSLKLYSNIKNFSSLEKSIISNGFSLAKKITQNFDVKKNDKIIWLGYKTQSGLPVDLVIGKHRFSLKEESFILENMGLYRYLSLITKKEFPRGLHIFKNFAPEEYDNWFKWTWSKLIKSARPFIYRSLKYNGYIKFDDQSVSLLYKQNNGKLVESRLPKKPFGIDVFESNTVSITREKVFSKWVNKYLSKDIGYLSVKKKAAVKAGDNLVKFIMANLDKELLGLQRLLQIYDDEYYYAKTTGAGVQIYKVPSKSDFNKVVKIGLIKVSVPKSQLNLLTEIKNIDTGKSLILRNEIRFSHGQFNGTPEAKMYYEGSLENIYEKIC